MGDDQQFPRDLTTQEKDFLFWLLPEERAGYCTYRDYVEQWKVVAQGRRGSGNFILAPLGVAIDIGLPLPQVLAYGIAETIQGMISITIRERLDNQVEFDIQNLTSDAVPESLQEIRRWTYSRWYPEQSCLICGGTLREIPMRTRGNHRMVLAICAADRRLWVYDERTGVNHPIPVTNFYNELMLHEKVRDPKIVFDFDRLFTELSKYADSDLLHAFATYNQLRTKIPIEEIILGERKERPSLAKRIVSIFRKDD